MLSRILKRTLLETTLQLPPTFLLPWAATLSTASRSSKISTSVTKSGTMCRPETAGSTSYGRQQRASRCLSTTATTTTPTHDHLVASPPPIPSLKPSNTASPVELSPSVRELLPLMRAQAPHYINLHIHGKQYLVTQGDTVRLPFLMPDVEPGDVLRLNRAILLGSRDFTLKAPASAPGLKSPTKATMDVVDPISENPASHFRVMQTNNSLASSPQQAPHFIPHIAKGKHSYVDDRLYVCRAIVLGVESEPMRIKEKTKRRQRHVKRVKSKHRYTIVKIKELRVKSIEELETKVE